GAQRVSALGNWACAVRLARSVRSSAIPHPTSMSLFFSNDTATTEFYTLSLHDALPISSASTAERIEQQIVHLEASAKPAVLAEIDRKSTRLNSSHLGNSYAVSCLKKKREHRENEQHDRPPCDRQSEPLHGKRPPPRYQQ